jgi:Ca2+-transporting ATPase
MDDETPMEPKLRAGAWHTQSAAEVCAALEVDPRAGLGDTLAAQRRARYGDNTIQEQRSRGLWRLLLSQFTDFMIMVLIAAAIVAGALGEVIDSLAIMVIIMLNGLIGFLQDYRAEQAIHALRQLAAPTAKVRRNGRLHTLAASELVPGDVVLLETGNIVPADLRALEAVQLLVNEASLTGESVSVEKDPAHIADSQSPLGERRNMLYKGTIVSQGRGSGVVTATGMATELGRIAALLQQAGDNRTPLQRRLARFGRRLALAVLAVCAVIFAAGLLRGEPVLLMFLTAVSLAVAAIPEALPAVVTITLALGARKMVRRNALIRRLPAVESLGSVTYICSDKTGTLTENSMRLEGIFADGDWHETWPDHGELWGLIGSALALNNEVAMDGTGTAVGDPTEVALYRAAHDAGFIKEDLERRVPRIAEVPFDSRRMRMTTLHAMEEGVVAYSKGAPERVLPLCRAVLSEDGVMPLDLDQWQRRARDLAEQGYRVLAIAYRHWLERPPDTEAATLEQQLILLGLLALIDPPRAEVPEAVALCRQAGIIPVMITGDHPATARAIALRLGICGEDDAVMLGSELAAMNDEELAARIEAQKVYARVDPAQKIRIVTVLQQRGHFVAMTGDGVNDAPALKRADIGVAMGRIGTDVAREASQLVLLDDNFATIVSAVREGRRIFDNIRKFIKYTLTSNSGEIWTLFLAPFLGMPSPLLPIHLLWINLVTDGLPGLALSMEMEEKDIMRRAPRPPDESVFAHGLWQHMIWVGLLIGGVSLFTQAWALNRDSPHWQTMAFTTLTLAQLVHVLVIRSETQSLLTIGLLSNRPLLGAVLLTVLLQLAVIYLPLLQPIFKTQALSGGELAFCLAMASVIFFAVEMEKWLIRRGYIYRSARPESG